MGEFGSSGLLGWMDGWMTFSHTLTRIRSYFGSIFTMSSSASSSGSAAVPEPKAPTMKAMGAVKKAEAAAAPARAMKVIKDLFDFLTCSF